MRDFLAKRMGSAAVVATILAATALADDKEPSARFVGAVACQSSGCHGGAGPKRNQNIVWNKFDFHSRAYAILTTSRSTRITETLQIQSATESARCTVCHSPFQAVPAAQLAKTAHPDEGVSCESCHGAAEPWLRSHTRPDFTHRDRINGGMRELKSSYARASACVACHEILDPVILAAGHPKLILELDSQLVSQPPHWPEGDSWQGPRAWLTGQAVALREQSWKRGDGSGPRWKALVWLLRQIQQNEGSLPKPPAIGEKPTDQDFAQVQHWADEFARAAQDVKWSDEGCSKLLKTLSGQEAATTADLPEKVSRAEVLVQALDRLTVALKKNGRKLAGADEALGTLFADVRDEHAFDPLQFSQHLNALNQALSSAAPVSNAAPKSSAEPRPPRP